MPRIEVLRLHMASPLEVVLAAVANEFAPAACAATAMLIFERSMRLIMDWQRHRAELLAMDSEAPTEPNAEDIALAIRTVREGLPQYDVFVMPRPKDDPSSESPGEDKFDLAVGRLAKIRVIEVVRLDD
jgi:hypothetical protein